MTRKKLETFFWVYSCHFLRKFTSWHNSMAEIPGHLGLGIGHSQRIHNPASPRRIPTEQASLRNRRNQLQCSHSTPITQYENEHVRIHRFFLLLTHQKSLVCKPFPSLNVFFYDFSIPGSNESSLNHINIFSPNSATPYSNVASSSSSESKEVYPPGPPWDKYDDHKPKENESE